jgi:hypothetical protein
VESSESAFVDLTAAGKTVRELDFLGSINCSRREHLAVEFTGAEPETSIRNIIKNEAAAKEYNFVLMKVPSALGSNIYGTAWLAECQKEVDYTLPKLEAECDGKKPNKYACSELAQRRSHQDPSFTITQGYRYFQKACRLGHKPVCEYLQRERTVLHAAMKSEKLLTECESGRGESCLGFVQAAMQRGDQDSAEGFAQLACTGNNASGCTLYDTIVKMRLQNENRAIAENYRREDFQRQEDSRRREALAKAFKDLGTSLSGKIPGSTSCRSHGIGSSVYTECSPN